MGFFQSIQKMVSPVTTRFHWLGFWLGPLLALAVYFALPESYPNAAGETVAIGHAIRLTAGLGAWMAVWWLSEAAPIPVTALLPLVVLPLFQVNSIKVTAGYYSHELIFLFMGGFFISLAMSRWGLHRRIALMTLQYFGRSKSALVGGFMLVSAALSMWISNTATTIMMLPIAMSVVGLIETRVTEGESEIKEDFFPTAMLLGMAYGASIGGMATLIGSPPNLFLASYVRESLGADVSFLDWFLIGFPIACLLLPMTWLLLTRKYAVDRRPFEGGRRCFREEYLKLGPMNLGSKITMAVFFSAAGLWLTRPFLASLQFFGMKPLAGLTDAGISMLAGLVLFIAPVNVKERTFVLDWKTAVTLPWGILILFGGGLSLAGAIDDHGVGAFLGSLVSQWHGFPTFALVAGVTLLIVFLTELTSNTATTATMVPILGALALGMGVDPFLLIFPAALAASCAFMMPVATPPNAIVFGSGKITIAQMARTGWWLNLMAIVVITLVCYFLVIPILDLNP